MLPEEQIIERAVYCYCAFLQLSWLYSNESVEPPGYVALLKKSSLGLGEDGFVVETIEEGLMEERPDGGVLSLISFYEGLAHAFCDVLETTMEEMKKTIAPEFLETLASEMGARIR